MIRSATVDSMVWSLLSGPSEERGIRAGIKGPVFASDKKSRPPGWKGSRDAGRRGIRSRLHVSPAPLVNELCHVVDRGVALLPEAVLLPLHHVDVEKLPPPPCLGYGEALLGGGCLGRAEPSIRSSQVRESLFHIGLDNGPSRLSLRILLSISEASCWNVPLVMSAALSMPRRRIRDCVSEYRPASGKFLR